jgi:EAL and modified HD-GYP domain-containing signal transduction protein
MSLFKLLELITSDAEVGEIEEVVKGSPDLVFRLLKLVNSAALGRSQKVSNLRSAIIVLGREQLGRLVQIMFFKLGNERPVRADPLAQAAVVRGRMMEGLVGAVGVSPALKPSAFMLGMLSLADALFGETPEQLAAFLALDEVMCAALLRREGPLGRMLAVVEMAEQVQTVAQAELLAALLAETGIGDIATLTQLQLEALRFTNDL